MADHDPSHSPRAGYAGSQDDAHLELDDGASAIHRAPPVGEEIHMPGPSLIPILNAVGITIALLGVTSSKFVLAAGLILFLVTTVLWVRDTRHEIAALPAEHDHH